MDPGALVPEILLYDRLLFPQPTQDDLRRWGENGWKPDDLGRRLADLGPLAHTVSWTEELRTEWGTRFDRMADLAKQADGIAFGCTPLTIATTAWDDLEAQRAEKVPPVPVAAFQSAEEARAIAAFEPQAVQDNPEVHRGVALLFRQCLAMPVRTHGPVQGQMAFEKAVALSKSASYQQARRALYD